MSANHLFHTLFLYTSWGTGLFHMVPYEEVLQESGEGFDSNDVLRVSSLFFLCVSILKKLIYNIL